MTMGPKPISLCTGCSLQRAGCGRVILMAVSKNDVADGFICKAVQQCLDMIGISRPGVDHRDFTFPNDISSGAMKCERSGVFCRQSAHTLRDPLYGAVAEIMRAQEWNLGHVS